MIHPVLDCVLDWRRDNPAAMVEKVVVTGNPLLAARTDRPNISTGRESQVSVQHAVAAALVTGKAGVEQFTDACVNDPDGHGAARQSRGGARRSFATIAAAVAITTADGKTHKLSQPAARGSDTNPMSDEDLEEKLRTRPRAGIPRHDIAPLIDAVWALDKSQDISKLAALTVPRAELRAVAARHAAITNEWGWKSMNNVVNNKRVFYVAPHRPHGFVEILASAAMCGSTCWSRRARRSGAEPSSPPRTPTRRARPGTNWRGTTTPAPNS